MQKKRLGIITVEFPLREAERIVFETLSHPVNKDVLWGLVEPVYMNEKSGAISQEFIDSFVFMLYREIFDRMKLRNLDGLMLINENFPGGYFPVFKTIVTNTNQGTIAHEIGHFLGLDHPDKRCNDYNKNRNDCKYCQHDHNIMGCRVNEWSHKIPLSQCYWSDSDLVKLGLKLAKTRK